MTAGRDQEGGGELGFQFPGVRPLPALRGTALGGTVWEESAVWEADELTNWLWSRKDGCCSVGLSVP